jgi:hypothetical protein
MNNPEAPNKLEPKLLYLLLSIPVIMFGLMGAGLQAITGKDPLSGFIWGIIIGVVMSLGILIWTYGWEWIKKRIEEGKLSAYLIVGFLIAVAIAGYLALTLGRPSCVESDSEPQGGCIEYADDGYKATDAQKWEKFWQTLPVTTIIACLAAALIHSKSQQKK